MAWKLYTDAACTSEFGGTLNFLHYSDFSDNPQDRVLYYADVERDPMNAGTYKMVMPLGGNINLSIVDANPGSGHEATEIKMATTSAGLDSAVAGAALSLGTQLISGTSGKREVHIRVTNAVTAAGVSLELTVRKPETIVLAA